MNALPTYSELCIHLLFINIVLSALKVFFLLLQIICYQGSGGMHSSRAYQLNSNVNHLSRDFATIFVFRPNIVHCVPVKTWCSKMLQVW